MHEHNGISPFVCACFTLNYLIGTGFLTLPWAFESGGIVLSLATLIFTCIVANAASDYILSAMARADALVMLQQHENGTEATSLLSKGIDNANTYRSLALQMDGDFSSEDGNYEELVAKHGKLLIRDRKFELTELVRTWKREKVD